MTWGDASAVAGVFAGVFALLMLGLTIFGDMPLYAKLKSEGFVSSATVTGKEKLETNSRRRRGGTTYHTSYFLNVRYNATSDIKYSDVVSGKVAPPTAAPTPKDPNAKADPFAFLDANIARLKQNTENTSKEKETFDLGVSFDDFEAANMFDSFDVVFAPTSSHDPVKFEAVKNYSPMGKLVGGFISLMAGIGLWMWGWPRRSRGPVK
jgi:hypothetical protein